MGQVEYSQDEERNINPLNDEMSPIQSYDPGLDDEPTIPVIP